MSKITVCEISGMGPIERRDKGEYEWGCQIIALRAARYYSQNHNPVFEEYKGVTGLIVAKNESAEQLEKFVMAHPTLKEYGVTGAMMQYGIHHGRQLAKLGREGYLKMCREHRKPEDFYEFDEEDAFPEGTAK